MAFDSDIAVLAAVTTAIDWTMLYTGARKRMLDFRQKKRKCPACGRHIVGRTCNQH